MYIFYGCSFACVMLHMKTSNYNFVSLREFLGIVDYEFEGSIFGAIIDNDKFDIFE